LEIGKPMQNIDLFMLRVNIYKEVECIRGLETSAEYEIVSAVVLYKLLRSW
jgi:hypothetical protein